MKTNPSQSSTPLRNAANHDAMGANPIVGHQAKRSAIQPDRKLGGKLDHAALSIQAKANHAKEKAASEKASKPAKAAIRATIAGAALAIVGSRARKAKKAHAA